MAIVAEVMEEGCELCTETAAKGLPAKDGSTKYVCALCAKCDFCGKVWQTYEEATNSEVFEVPGKDKRDKFGCPGCVADAKREREEEQEEEERNAVCGSCAGSGEGSYSGSTCSACGGGGGPPRRRSSYRYED